MLDLTRGLRDVFAQHAPDVRQRRPYKWKKLPA